MAHEPTLLMLDGIPSSPFSQVLCETQLSVSGVVSMMRKVPFSSGPTEEKDDAIVWPAPPNKGGYSEDLTVNSILFLCFRNNYQPFHPSLKSLLKVV